MLSEAADDRNPYAPMVMTQTWRSNNKKLTLIRPTSSNCINYVSKVSFKIFFSLYTYDTAHYIEPALLKVDPEGGSCTKIFIFLISFTSFKSVWVLQIKAVVACLSSLSSHLSKSQDLWPHTRKFHSSVPLLLVFYFYPSHLTPCNGRGPVLFSSGLQGMSECNPVKIRN